VAGHGVAVVKMRMLHRVKRIRQTNAY
jgi:hypothetical protein